MDGTATAPAGPALQRLVASVRREVRRRDDTAVLARAVAGRVERALAQPNLLHPRHMEPDEEDYRQHVLHVEPDGSFSVVALVWLPGQETPVHDHVSWCVPGVYRGRERETRYRLAGASREAAARDGDSPAERSGTPGHLVEAGTEINEAGDVVALTPPGDIHRVDNPGPGKAVSLHVYGADIAELGSSIRRTYDLPVRTPA